MSDTVTSADRSRYRAFVQSQMHLIGKAPPDILWHYTNGNALIEIIKTGSLFSTQISCVNDTTEYSYSVNMLHAAFKRVRPSVAGQPDAVFLLDYIDSNISADTSTSEWFVTCFTENRDDLSQWRAYGNGENGYSLGFNSGELLANIVRNKCLLAPVQYDPAIHLCITDAVANATLQFFLDGWQVRRSSGITIDQWAGSFLTAWVDDITYLAPAMKGSGAKEAGGSAMLAP